MLEQDDKTLATSGNEYAQCVPAGEGVNGKTSTATSYQLPATINSQCDGDTRRF